MILTIVNNTAVAKSYLSGAVTLAGTIGATTTVGSSVTQLAIATDGAFKQDIFASNVYITDGTNDYGVNDGISYLSLIILDTGPTADGVGNDIFSNNNQLQVRDVINTAGQNRAQSVTTSAAEALGAATILVNRKVISITPTNGTIYWGFTNTVTTSTGTPIFKNQTIVIAATDNVHVYVVAAGTVDSRIAEGS